MSKEIKVIIFGSNGQDGYYLSKLLTKRNIDYIGISRNNSDVNGNVCNYVFVKQQIELYKPTHIFHFAANSTTQHVALFENHQSISTGTLNILEAVRLICPDTKIFITGSAMQFENKGLPINEQTPFDPSSAYSVARIQSVYASRYYRNKFGLNIYIGYFFNHDSSLRREQHINQKIIKAVKQINSGSSNKLKLGNIEVKKEFNFAGDMVEASWILINQNKIFEAVIGSGIAYSIRDWLEYCFGKINKKWQDYILLDDNFFCEYQILVSDPVLIKSLGWEQKIDFKSLADKMLSLN